MVGKEDFSVGEKLSSFEAPEKKIKSFQRASFVQLWKRDRRTKRRLTKFIKYYDVKLL